MQKVNIDKLKKSDYASDEAFKTLRTNIQFSGSDNKVIAITSCTPNDGKSTVSFNLAISLAEAGKRVIFIDADLRKSVLVGRYKLAKQAYGFSHFLSGMAGFDMVVAATNIEKLHVVFSGPIPPNPAELLGNKYFKSLVQQLRENYDYVIIDTPPLGSVVDSMIVARECDSVMLVVAANSTSRKFANKIKTQFERNDIKLLGVVLNKVPRGKKKYGYGNYGYGKYGQYGQYGNYKNIDAKKEEKTSGK